ncbi:ABC transporter permease [Kurthia sibirica]|uniref:Putative hemin transport system permease protein HrtB n=1 Tax=Kurthia sibirica TaxID=202750 RepID=A0A2U3AGT1_9BACL|nr:FtsX-like permease family protein [Kurthia sibirica]PWI23704.1 cell division protein FtsX [Kurthia sibirica]GEK35241.1 ABC transporter permease [Kurthia sibirica]
MFLAWNELKHAKLRYGMMTMIIILIAWLVFILSGLGNGLSTLSAATLKNFDAQYAVYEETAGSKFTKSMLSEELIEEIKQQKGVDNVAAFGSSTISVGKTKSKDAADKEDVALIGLEPDTYIMPKIIEGKSISTANKKGVVINDTLKKAGYKIGDTLLVSNATLELTVVGFVKNETFNHLPSAFVVMDTWRDYQFAAPGSDNGIKKPVQTFFLQGEDLDTASLDHSITGVETVTKKEAINGMPGYTAENGTIMMMLAFCIVISAFIIAVFFYVITMQKTQQFGVMKAIGASNGFIGRAIVSQVILLSVFGIGIGVLLTYVTAMILPENMPFSLDPTLVTIYALVLLVIALLSSIISVRQIVKIDPLTALGRVE